MAQFLEVFLTKFHAQSQTTVCSLAQETVYSHVRVIDVMAMITISCLNSQHWMGKEILKKCFVILSTRKSMTQINRMANSSSALSILIMVVSRPGDIGHPETKILFDITRVAVRIRLTFLDNKVSQ